MEPTLPSLTSLTSVPSRVRRGNTADHRQMQAAIVAAALELFKQGGTDAVTMQALASSLGRSAMSLYRYFESKSAVLQELWRVVYAEGLVAMRTRVEAQTAPRERHRALLESFLDFFESHPDYYQLVYRTSGSGSDTNRPLPDALMPYYGDIISLATNVTAELADELGTGHERIPLASELRLAFLMGFLQSRFANPRYPWRDLSLLRDACVEAIMASVVLCLEGRIGAAPRDPAAG